MLLRGLTSSANDVLDEIGARLDRLGFAKQVPERVVGRERFHDEDL
jgi:hypothetical protein